MKEKLKIIINDEKGECITSEAYKVIARGLVNRLGKDVSKVLVKEFKEKDNENN